MIGCWLMISLGTINQDLKGVSYRKHGENHPGNDALLANHLQTYKQVIFYGYVPLPEGSRILCSLLLIVGGPNNMGVQQRGQSNKRRTAKYERQMVLVAPGNDNQCFTNLKRTVFGMITLS